MRSPKMAREMFLSDASMRKRTSELYLGKVSRVTYPQLGLNGLLPRGNRVEPGVSKHYTHKPDLQALFPLYEMPQLTVSSYSQALHALKMLLLSLLLLPSFLTAFPEEWLDPANKDALVHSMNLISIEYSNYVSSRFEHLHKTCYKSARMQSLRAFFGRAVALPGTKSIVRKNGVPMPHFRSWETNETVYIDGDTGSWNLDAFEAFMKNVISRDPMSIPSDGPIINPKVSENFTLYLATLKPPSRPCCESCVRLVFNGNGAPTSSRSIWFFDLTLILLIANLIALTGDRIRGKRFTERLLKTFKGTASSHAFTHPGLPGILSYTNDVWLYGKIPTDRPFATVVEPEPSCKGLLPFRTHLLWERDNCYMVAARPAASTVAKGDPIISAICLDSFPLRIDQVHFDAIELGSRLYLLDSSKMFQRIFG
jgi:hypothetical protein